MGGSLAAIVGRNKGTNIMTNQDTRRNINGHPFINSVLKSMRDNHDYLHENVKGLYESIIYFINLAIDLSCNTVQVDNPVEKAVKSAKNNFLYFILTPHSYAIYIDVLGGNLPAAFVEMRIILESLAECCLADENYPEEEDFQAKLIRLRDERRTDEDGKTRQISLTKRMNELEKLLDINGIVRLWSYLSNEWVHSSGLMNRVVSGMMELNVPSWCLAIPTTYSEQDLEDLETLSRNVEELRKIIEKAFLLIK